MTTTAQTTRQTCYCIYRTTIQTDDFLQTYVGQHVIHSKQTIGEPLTDGYLGSGKVITSITKTCREYFLEFYPDMTLSNEVLAVYETQYDVDEAERQFIEKERLERGTWGDGLDICLNITDGGEGWTSTDATRMNNQRVSDGTHPFLGGELQRKRVQDGTHNFLGGEINRKRVQDETHPFLGGELQRKRVQAGTHHFLGGDQQRALARKRVQDGTHHFLGGELQRIDARKRVQDGTHHLLNVKPWNNIRATKESKSIWLQADLYYQYWKEHQVGYKKLAYAFGFEKYKMTHQSLIKKFKAGWIPTEDLEWLKFKQEYGGQNDPKQYTTK